MIVLIETFYDEISKKKEKKNETERKRDTDIASENPYAIFAFIKRSSATRYSSILYERGIFK